MVNKLAGFFMVALAVYIFWAAEIDSVYMRRPVTYWEGCFGVTRETYHPGDPVFISAYAYLGSWVDAAGYESAVVL